MCSVKFKYHSDLSLTAVQNLQALLLILDKYYIASLFTLLFPFAHRISFWCILLMFIIIFVTLEKSHI